MVYIVINKQQKNESPCILRGREIGKVQFSELNCIKEEYKSIDKSKRNKRFEDFASVDLYKYDNIDDLVIVFALRNYKTNGAVDKGIYRISDNIEVDIKIKCYSTLLGDNILICSHKHYWSFLKERFGWIFIYPIKEPIIIKNSYKMRQIKQEDCCTIL